jgi:beta-glucosidase
VSWPRSVGQEPLYYNHLSTGRPPADIDLTHPPADIVDRYLSRYIDEQNTPQFPFGYGGSYSSFSYGAVKLNRTRLSAGALNRSLHAGGDASAGMTAEAEVTNTGSRQGGEVVQLYIQLRGTSVAEPVRMLKGFQTMAIAPGETKRVKFELKPEAFAIWNDHNEFITEPAHLTVWISPDSAQGSPAQAEIAP